MGRGKYPRVKNKTYHNKDWLYQKYIVDKLSIQEVANLCFCHAATIHRRLKKYNIPRRSLSEAHKGGIKSQESIIKFRKSIIKSYEKKNPKLRLIRNKSWLQNRYTENNWGTSQIASFCDCDVQTVRKSLKFFDIPIRSNQEANKLVGIKKRGKEHQNWKGGRINCNGYIQIKKEKHPFLNKSGYILEHRFIMENYLEKTNPNHLALIEIDKKLYLRPEYTVHHRDTNKSNNKITNLELWHRGHPKGYKVCTCCGGFK